MDVSWYPSFYREIMIWICSNSAYAFVSMLGARRIDRHVRFVVGRRPSLQSGLRVRTCAFAHQRPGLRKYASRTLEGLFRAVSKPIFAIKYSFDSFFSHKICALSHRPKLKFADCSIYAHLLSWVHANLVSGLGGHTSFAYSSPPLPGTNT